MKIVFVSPSPNASGGARVIARHAIALKQRGHDVTLVYPPRARATWSETFRLLIGRHWRLSRLVGRASSHYDELDVAQIELPTRRPVTDDDLPDADVVIATWWETAEWVSELSPRKGARAYFLQHYEVFEHLPVDRVRRTWSLPMHKIVVCDWLADIARNEYGDTDVSVVRNSVDTEQFDAPARERNPAPTVGFMYGAARFKGAQFAIEAIERLSDRRPSLKALSFGSTPPIRSLALPRCVDFFLDPSQSLIPKLYARCDVWIVPSLVEGFGLPILEAMACRTPVVSSHTGAAPDLLSGGAGILVEPGDSAALAAAVDRVLGLDETKWLQMSETGYALAHAYTWDHATNLFENALLRAIEKSQSRSR